MRDYALCERVEREFGIVVEARQLRRWRAWRRVGFVPRSAERVRGWRPGLASSLPDGEVVWVAEAACLALRIRSLDRVALALSARGFPLEAGAVRAAFLAWFEREAARPARLRDVRAAWAAAGLPAAAEEVSARSPVTNRSRPSGLAMLAHVAAVRAGRTGPVLGGGLTGEDVLTVAQERDRLGAATGAGVVYALAVGYGRTDGLDDRDGQTLGFAFWYLVYGPGGRE